MLLLWFILIVMFVRLLIILCRIALWPPAGKQLSPWLFICVVFICSTVLVVRVRFPFGVWGSVCNSIVSVPDHCLFIYFEAISGYMSLRHLILLSTFNVFPFQFEYHHQKSHDMTKPTMWLCAQRRLRSAWASAQSDQSLRCAING